MLFQRGHPGYGYLIILGAHAAAHPDRPNQLPTNDDGIAARRRDDAFDCQQRETDPAAKGANTSRSATVA